MKRSSEATRPSYSSWSEDWRTISCETGSLHNSSSFDIHAPTKGSRAVLSAGKSSTRGGIDSKGLVGSSGGLGGRRRPSKMSTSMLLSLPIT
eukprot:scaffold207885_cov18-Tisochrysis_lutea.AAC.2